MNRLMRVFLDTHMGLGHKGLTRIARDHNVSLLKLQPGEHVVFVNKAVDRMKVFSANNVVSYLLSKDRLDLGALNHFSECYGAKGFQYDDALRRVLLKRMEEKR